MTDLRERYGKYALITGASSGIGAEFAEQLAAAGLDLVLVARRKDRLEALAGRLRATHGVSAEVIALDLAAEGAVAELIRRTERLDVGLVVASAGVLTTGPFLSNDFAAEAELLRVNLVVPAEMAHAFGRHFVARGHGALILLSSVVGFGPVPYSANYGAVKGYIASLGQALHYELRGSGVDVLTLAPGLTQTEGADNAPGIDFGRMPGKAVPPGPVVRAALRGLGRTPLVIPGANNKIQDFLGKYLMPRRAQTAMSGVIVRHALRDAPLAGEVKRTA